MIVKYTHTLTSSEGSIHTVEGVTNIDSHCMRCDVNTVNN